MCAYKTQQTWSRYTQNVQQPAVRQKLTHLQIAACQMAAQAVSGTQKGATDSKEGGKERTSTFPSLQHLTEDGLCKEQQHSGRWKAGRLLLKHTTVPTTVTYVLFTSSQSHHWISISILYCIKMTTVNHTFISFH